MGGEWKREGQYREAWERESVRKRLDLMDGVFMWPAGSWGQLPEGRYDHLAI